MYRRGVPSKSQEANTPSAAELASLFSALQVELVGLKSHVAERDTQIASLQETVLNLTHENALLKRRLLPYWPRDRYLELAPGSWLDTRAKLDPDELSAPVCSFTIPA